MSLMSKNFIDDKTDVRMKGFLKKMRFQDALLLVKRTTPELEVEVVDILNAPNRILAEDVVARFDIPLFSRSAMDGYAVIAEDTFGASPLNPIELPIVGEAFPGKKVKLALKQGTTIKIMTGAMLPKNANAVVMAEYTEEKNHLVKVFAAVPPGKNVIHAGDDFRKGDVAIRKKTKIRPEHIGILANLNKTQVRVFKKPTVAIIATGNEIVRKRRPFKTIDSNSPMLAALAKDSGALPSIKPIVKDDKEKIKKAILSCIEDIILITGGTSVGEKDLAPIVVLDEGKLVFHGVSMRPASPAGFGVVKKKPIFLLPGSPVGAFIGFEAFVRPAIYKMQGCDFNPFDHLRKAKYKLTGKIASQAGRTDFVRVKIERNCVLPFRLGGASALRTVAEASGVVVVPENVEGYNTGESIEVNLF
ncbi:MAG: molybdopterin molybdotransferase MoeA [Candidatus Woesearchaeota archaeon]